MALGECDVSLLRVSKRLVQADDVGFILLQHFIGFDIVAEVLAEVFAIHIARVGVDILLKELVNRIASVFGLLLFLVPEYSRSYEELKEFIPTDISFS